MASALQELRKAAGYKTAKEFATELDIPATTYGRYEADPKKIPLSSAWNIADALGCTIDAVVGRSEPDPEAQRGSVQAFYDGLSEENRELFDEFRNFVSMRERSQRRKRRQEENRKYDCLLDSYEEQFLDSLTFGDADSTPTTPDERRAAFEKFIKSRARSAREARVASQGDSILKDLLSQIGEFPLDENGRKYLPNEKREAFMSRLNEYERCLSEAEALSKELASEDDELIAKLMDAYDRKHGLSSSTSPWIEYSFIEFDSSKTDRFDSLRSILREVSKKED